MNGRGSPYFVKKGVHKKGRHTTRMDMHGDSWRIGGLLLVYLYIPVFTTSSVRDRYRELNEN